MYFVVLRMKYKVWFGLLFVILAIMSGCNQKEIIKIASDEDKIAYVENAWKGILVYIEENDENLTTQLKMVRNGTADKVIDSVLQEKVDNLHDYLTENLTANEVVKFGFERLLWQIYDIDDMLNPKNITRVDLKV